MSDEYAIREADQGDIDGILDVLRAALGETPILRRTPELFRWKHYDNPFGESIVLVATAGDRIVGVRAFMRWRLLTPSGRVVECVRPVDTATHPDFSRRGIFRALTMSAVEIARNDSVDLVFNTPNPKSAPGYLSMGWEHVGWIGAMVRPRFGSATPTSPGIPRLRDAVPGADAVPTELSAGRPARGLRTPRTEPYLSWRFRAHPGAKYGWVSSGRGGAVVRASQRNGRTETRLVDILNGAGARAARSVVSKSRSRYVAAWFSRGSPERTAAIASGLLPIPGAKTLRLVALSLTDVDPNPKDFGSWDLAVSDMELL